MNPCSRTDSCGQPFFFLVKFLPHEVADLEPAFQFLKMQTKRSPWETRYILFIWLSLMCMIPFDLKSIDSQASKDSSRVGITILSRMILTAQRVQLEKKKLIYFANIDTIGR